MPSVREVHEFAPVGTRRLYVAEHRPDGPIRSAALFCLPIHEEEKSVYRPMADAARLAAESGCVSLLFHYSGTGDSSGSPLDTTVDTLVRDTLDAARILRERSGVESITLVGIRLGAAIALLAAEQVDVCAGLLLIEPVQSGRLYLSRARTRKRVRRMVTAAEGGDAATVPPDGPEEPQASEVFDFDGHPIAPGLEDSLSALDLGQRTAPLPVPVEVIEIAPRDRVSGAIERLGSALEARGARVTLRALVGEPFWNNLGVVHVPEVCQAIVRFVASG